MARITRKTMTTLAMLIFLAPGLPFPSHAEGPRSIQPIASQADTPFPQEYREPFVAWEQPVGEARVALALDRSGTLWATGPWGVLRLLDGQWKAPAGEELGGPAFAIATEGDQLWLATWNGLYRIEDGRLARVALAGKPLGLVRLTGGRLFAGGPDGLWERRGESWQAVEGNFSRTLMDVVAEGDRLWIATSRGLFELQDGRTRRIFAPQDITSGAVRSLAIGPDQRLWIGTSGGIDVYHNGERGASYSGANGLPCTDVWRLRFDRSDELWVATAQGLARYDGQHWTWRHSLRWLPQQMVHDVAVADGGTSDGGTSDGGTSDGGTAYVATQEGLAILRRRTMTLAAKADHYERLVRARHVRPPGLVEHCVLARPGDVSSHAPTDTDNDGLFTGLYVAAESLRYAVTGDPQAAQYARESYRAIEFLQSVTGHPGFVARTVVPIEWGRMADPNRNFTPQEVAAERVANPRFKQVEKRWRASSDGKWLWKGDTSSDEITGHYFAYALYYDLVADDDERRRVADHVRRITDYIIDGGYTLRDLDGQPTLWGVWAPDRLWHDPEWQAERGCNSVEILSYLAVAHHVTGDAKYQRELARLFADERYAEAILEPKLSAPAEFTYIDDQLLALSYRSLLAYDLDPQRRATYLESLQRWFEVIRRDASPLYSFVYGGVRGGDFGAAECTDFLRRSPLDMVEWTVDNRHREDVKLVRRPVIEHLQVDRLLPPDERGLNKWDKNPYLAVAGSGGSSESSSVHWLLPYWMGRYYRIIGQSQGTNTR